MSVDKHIGAARLRLTHLAGLSAETAAAEQRILDGASGRLDQVNADLETLRPRAAQDGEAGERYQALMLERGQLEQVVAASRQAGAA